MDNKNKKWKTESIIRIIFVISFFCSNSLIVKYIKNLYNETELKWNNDSINLPSIKNEILSYKNMSNMSIYLH